MILKPHEIEYLHSLESKIVFYLRILIGFDWIKVGAILTALGTFALAGLAYHQASVSQDQLAEQLSEQRPWVWANIDPAKKPKATELAGGLAFTFPFDLTNAGHLPATGVALLTHILSEEPSTFAGKEDAVFQVCHSQQKASVAGVSLFPNQNVIYAERMAYMPEAALFYSPQPGGSKLRRILILPYMIACVVYKDPTGHAHHTPYIFVIGRWDHKIPGVHLIPANAQALEDVDYGIWPWDWNLVDPD